MSKDSNSQFKLKRLCREVMALSGMLALAACGGGGSPSDGAQTNTDGEVLSSLSTGYTLPSEISAVPTDNSGSGAALNRAFSSHLRAWARAAADLPATTDYAKAQTRKYVEERELEQFDIIEQVLGAVAQTNYADAAVVNQGPYTAMITWVEDRDGREIKTIEPWVVDSRMIVENGKDVNRVLVWIEEPDENNPGAMRMVKAEFKIYAAATVNSDGSFADYGDWDLNVKFNDSGSDYFVASSRVSGGQTTVKVHESHTESGGGGGGSFVYEMKGVLVRAAATGYGKVAYPDFDGCMSWPCTPSTKNASYAYNSGYLAVQVDGDSAPTYKDRDPANAVEMTRRYGLFYANADQANGIVAGDDVQKHKSFGFPIRYTDQFGATRHAYYGAWQGRHEIWNGDGLNAGDTVTRNDHGPQQTAQTYVASNTFNGTLTKRTLVDGDLSDIQDIVVETWINKNFNLRWDASANSGAGAWMSCTGYIDWVDNICRDHQTHADVGFSMFADFASLQMSSTDRKHVSISRWDSIAMMNRDYVYLTAGQDGASSDGFYAAQHGSMGKLEAVQPLEAYTPVDGDQVWVNIGGSIYIQYTGTGWVQKELIDFDQSTWTPTFGTNDQTFTPEVGREYYINNKGTNFVVKRKSNTGTDATDYEVKIELQSAANPVSVASILPAGTSYLATPWRKDVRYALITDSSSADFMKLVVQADDTGKLTVGSVVTSGEWGLQAYNGSNQPLTAAGAPVTVDEFGFPTGADRPVEFNWEYSENGWGTQQYLCSPDCSSTANYLILDNPVQLQPVVLVNGAGASKTLALQYDGWMHGMPDLYWELSKNGFQMTQAIADKVINIPAGTTLTDALDGSTTYYVKPLETSVFLNVVTTTDISNAGGTAPDINQASAVDLATVPAFTEHNMGAKPTGTAVKYSEGKPVQ
ncbi:MAG: hypothetical protein AB1810_09880 [Pseudomonadota bacterium]